MEHYSTKTDTKGLYTYIGMPAGRYRVVLQAPDGKTLVYTDALGDDVTWVDFDLRQGKTEKVSQEEWVRRREQESGLKRVGPVKIKYDRFRNLTDISTEIALELPRSSMSFSFTCPSDADTCAPNHTLIMLSHSIDLDMGWLLIRSHDMIFLVNGNRLDIGPTKWDGDASTGVEFVTASLTTTDLSRLARARKLELKIGPFELEIPAKDIATIGDLAGHVGHTPVK